MSQVLHGTWIPSDRTGFVQDGGFYFWVETTRKSSQKKRQNLHPYCLQADELRQLFIDRLGVRDSLKFIEDRIIPKTFLLPTANGEPLPSWELTYYLEREAPEAFTFDYWQVDCYLVETSVKLSNYETRSVCQAIAFLNDLHFLSLYNPEDWQLGADLLFWYRYSQGFKDVLLRDRYIPALKYRFATPAKSNGRKKAKSPSYEIYPAWEIVCDDYETLIEEYAPAMPFACRSGWSSVPETPGFYQPKSLLRHFSEHLLTQIVSHVPRTTQVQKNIAGTILEDCLNPDAIAKPQKDEDALQRYQKWQSWRDKIDRTQKAATFNVYFRLSSPDNPENPWQLDFLVSPKNDPSLRLSLADYWHSEGENKTLIQASLGNTTSRPFESELLLNLGYAARMYPQLWRGLESETPTGLQLKTEDAWEFLRETAWVLEDAGYKVMLPAWWTPTGRRRAKLRLRASGSSSSPGQTKAKSYVSLDALVEYQYELAIGDEPVSLQEWQELVAAKQPLVKFRGQWTELDLAKMKEILKFWQKQGEEPQSMTLMELLRREAEADEALEVQRDETLAQMLAQLNDKAQLSPVEDLPQFAGTLRDYQKRGVAWLSFLEQVGLNGCLADDMGLGKTVQVIARLVQERNDEEGVAPTLLIAPTSVLGNWQKEVSRFAPHLCSHVHHGSDRIQDSKTFKKTAADWDLAITSYTLARKDAKLLNGVEWRRIVLDEAQNIKNPKAAQTKAILKLSAQHRLALTGTPVENRLLDLWSIFNFLNPGYLGKQSQFRKSFELPIQKDNNPQQATTLKKLVEPFILRRVKTDKSIIKDLPDKIEQKVFCNLTKEQASLYEAVVKDVENQLQETEGIGRKGLILATLMKLKQICNHPRQFLQDGSEFNEVRSHKLSRLREMVEEVIAEGESLLVFTQFREIGDALERFLRHEYRYDTYYIHGGTSRQKRDRTIQTFQNPETPPGIFILSLKAGGVGITLTKANHVFHFDRWWNPAVENQASDRAFRIGQEKNVFVHKFVTLGSLEERIDQMIEDKQKLAESIVGSDEAWLTELDNDTFRDLIALNKSAVL